ncbi:MAG: hypothetical protein ACSLFP_12865 [Acidimicrobiales bacterium]
MAGASRRHLLALVAALLVGALAFLVPSALASAGPLECDPPDVLCEPTTTTPTTVEETTTSLATTTTAAPPPPQSTSTTVRRTTTTERQVLSTTTTALDVTTSLDVLVPGDGTEGAESTTTTVQTVTRVSSDGTSDGTLIAIIVGGLVALALFVSVLTWRYWAATRPPEDTAVGSDHG